MILRDELKPGVQYRISNCAHWTDHQIQQMIVNKATEYGVSLGFRQDSLYNTLFESLLKLLATDCIVIYDSQIESKSPTPAFIMRIQREGTYLFITINEYVYSFYNANWCAIVGDVFSDLFS